MRLCVFEDTAVHLLEPLTLTRPAWSLWCGAATLLERQRRVLAPAETGVEIRPELVALCRIRYPASFNQRRRLFEAPMTCC